MKAVLSLCQICITEAALFALVQLGEGGRTIVTETSV